MTMIYPVILSGGSGSRLWPVSRSMHPKQFLSLNSDLPMLIETALRFQRHGFYVPSVICNHEHRFMVAQSFTDANLAVDDIILEPMARNTAPAITVAALNVLKKDPAGLILILPSDHIISDVESFVMSVHLAKPMAEAGQLITFGIEPKYPETGYGYIQGGNFVKGSNYVKKVQAFHEKPDRENAQNYIDSGSFYWNSGMFLFAAQQVIDELNVFSPEMVSLSRLSLEGARQDLDFLRLSAQPFEEITSVSIDYALMEKTKNAAVMPVNIGWNDLGSWSSLWDVSKKDANGNGVQGDVILEGVKNSLVHTDGGSLVAVLGLNNVIVVNNDDVVLVADKERSQDVKVIVEKLKAQKRTQVDVHSTIYRPWGSYKTIDTGKNYLVKTISVRPGCALSLQYHNHRAEHWVVVSGEAKVQRGEDVFVLKKNESTYIPVMTVHRLENMTNEPLQMIEVQSGDYLDEDDIVRLEDLYGRKQ